MVRMTTRDPEPADPARALLEELSQFATVQFEVGRAFARTHGLHPTDAAAVLEIVAAEERGQPLTPARLAGRVGLTSGATSILVGRLVDAGHISRSKEASDKRLVSLRATDKVHRSADAFSDPIAAAVAGDLADVDAEDLRRAAAIVRRAASLTRARLGFVTDG
jgi:MarR family transcriptional regulator, organic hydroperoxide resistance regulator